MTAPQWEPSAEAVEAFQRDMLSACGMTAQGTVVRYVLRRQNERESGLLEALRRVARTPLDGINHADTASAALAAHAKLDAPKVPTLLEAAKAAVGPADMDDYTNTKWIAVRANDYAALKAAVEREEHRA